ncbi:MAG: oligosaccharide flippase family protein, partial [Pseudomonadota bacterium]
MSFQNISSKTISMSLFWSVLENGGLSVLSLFALVIYARFLSPAEFGLVATALAFIELLSVITGMMFHDALIRHPKPTSRHYDTALYTTILLSVVFCLAIIGSSSKFEDLMKEPGSAEIVTALSFGLALTGFSATVSARLKKDFLFKKLALRSLISRALGLLLGVVAAIWGAGAWSLVIQYISMSAFSTIILWVYAPKSYTPKLQFGLSELIELLKFGSVSVTAILVQHSIKRVFVISCGIYLGAYATGL